MASDVSQRAREAVMTIDNHPLTPKPVDDRGTGFQVTQADRDLLDAICGPYFTFKPGATRERLQMIARHREQAERGLVEGIPLRFDPRLAKQWWMDRNTSSFVSAKLAGDGYVKFQWRDADEAGDYSVPWVVVALDLARKALDTRP